MLEKLAELFDEDEKPVRTVRRPPPRRKSA
jgi:hypothetical protein